MTFSHEMLDLTMAQSLLIDNMDITDKSRISVLPVGENLCVLKY